MYLIRHDVVNLLSQRALFLIMPLPSLCQMRFVRKSACLCFYENLTFFMCDVDTEVRDCKFYKS